MKDKIMLTGVLCDLTPLNLCISGCHTPFSPWSISSSAEVVLTVQSLHLPSCVSYSCVPISPLSHQKTPGTPSKSLSCGRFLSQCLPCCLSGNPAVPMGGSSSVTHLFGADLVWFSSQLAVCVLVHGGIPMGAFCCQVCGRRHGQSIQSVAPQQMPREGPGLQVLLSAHA